MPALTRPEFIQATDGMLANGSRMLTKDGTLYETLYGFNRRAEITSFIALPDPAAWPADAEATALPGRLADHADQIGQVFRTNRVQAAIHLGEARLTPAEAPNLSELAARLEQARLDPTRVEIVFVHGLWPREYLDRAKVAAIQRRPDGTITGTKEITLGSIDGGALVFHASWLGDTLPRPSRH